MPVFSYENTTGQALEHVEKVNNKISKLPLIEKAKQWGIDVKAVCDNGFYWGCLFSCDTKRTIQLATPQQSVFFHELAPCCPRKNKR